LKPSPDWKVTLEKQLPLFGHRNWLVIADAAYPAQSRPGIETHLSGESQQATIECVLANLGVCRHLRPIIHVDQELELVDEKDAPGVDSYRLWLRTALDGFTVSSDSHEEIIAKLDRAAQMFSVLVIKSTMTIPYTSVFIELDCGYWNAESEARLRSAISSVKKREVELKQVTQDRFFS
jgi:L-fucose mutarotase/ribose pyranase (RbsD/FucU family)